MIFKTSALNLTIEISNEILNNIIRVGKSHYPNEFGGFLLGNYTNNDTHLIITDSLEPIKYSSSISNFERSLDGIENLFLKKHQEIPSKKYVGEWHTHPNSDANPSRIDNTAVNLIVKNPNSNLANPILLIIGYTEQKTETCFYIYFNNKFYNYVKN